MITTAYIGTNAELFPQILAMYVKDGATIADVTYGKGVFWSKVDTTKYSLWQTDLQMGVDFKRLPYSENFLDVLVLDPPYMHGGATVKESINKCYRNANTSHASVIRLYAGGVLEACRVLKKGGLIILKSQDEIESGKQHWSHMELINLLTMFGYEVLDLFVLVQNHLPALKDKVQKHARKNHSYAIVAKLK